MNAHVEVLLDKMINEIYLCSNKCRLCLCNEKFQIPIFGEVAQEMQIYLKIRTCLPVQVSPDDDLPKTICYKCVSTLEQSYNLWKVSSESEAVLKNFSSKTKQDLPVCNMQHQSFCSKPSQANNRKLLLPTGVLIIVETDSDEEQMPQEQMYIKQLCGGNTVPMNTCPFFPEPLLEPSLGTRDTSPDFLESLSEPTPGIGDTSPDFLQSLSEPSPGIWDTSPDFLQSLSEPSASTRCQNSYGPGQCDKMITSCEPNILQSLAKPTPHISDSAPIRTMDQRGDTSSANNRWCSISLFGMSANTWRDFYRSGETFQSCEPMDGVSHKITERDVHSGDVTTAKPTDSRTYGEVLQATNERNCKAISQCSNTTNALLNFLQANRPYIYDNTPEQGPI